MLILKGWVMFSLVNHEEGATCLAAAASAESTEPPGRGQDDPDCCRDSMTELITKIREENERLAERAHSLDEKEKRLQVFRIELDEKTAKLARMRKAVEKMHQEIMQQERESHTKLVKIYEAMEPEDAALRLESMEDAVASQVIMNMNGRKAGQIIGAMAPEKAARLTRRISELSGKTAK
jgi:flagellar motility protein MotE (MotC chaperone)